MGNRALQGSSLAAPNEKRDPSKSLSAHETGHASVSLGAVCSPQAAVGGLKGNVSSQNVYQTRQTQTIDFHNSSNGRKQTARQLAREADSSASHPFNS